ncbi:hypothetical protein ACS0TY_000080 [Phlomoides rotata]
MYSKTPPNNMKKRSLEESNSERPRKILPRDPEMGDDACGKKIFQFRVLLPNSTTIELKMTELRNDIPVKEFIDELRKKYNAVLKQRKEESKRGINWDYKDIHFTDAQSRRIRLKVNLQNFMPNKWQFLWLHDGSVEPGVYEGMWDLTPDTDLLKELPDDYTFETALADLIDNSLQALWSNSKGERRLISIGFSPKKISIFDSGPGMDGSNGNLVKWGKMGASLHRSMRGKAVGGEPPYLMPFFGMFGYGGAVATMCLGKRVIVSSKTKTCNKVFTLHLEREALVSASHSENCWRTTGGIRDSTEAEKDKSPHGSFTKVEIFEPKVKKLDIKRFRCKLKDIYFPYIQCDEVSGKTSTPVEFQVNEKDLTEIRGGEVATTNLHSCNGPDFVVQLHFSINQDSPLMAGQDQRVFLEANARVKCVYFPMVEGEESIQRILDALDADDCGIRESFESFSRVSVRRLGRLLPDTRWALLPFMEAKQKKGDKGHALKRICSRVKCFIDTDAGFNPTPHKTDLAQHHPYTKALKNFGNRAPENEKEVQIKIFRDEKQLNLSELEKQYNDWTSQMHGLYDVESDGGVDKPTIVVVSSKIQKLDTSSDVLRVHTKIKRKDKHWVAGQNIKVLKGACQGCHQRNLFATLEYIIFEGLHGDTCGEARLICRPLGVPEDKGCHLLVKDGNKTIDIRDSLALPIRVIDSEKCTPVDGIEWGKKLEAYNQKLPSYIDLLSGFNCQELEMEEALPTSVQAGDAPPEHIVAVIRPKCFNVGNCSNKLDQKYIIKEKFEMTLEVKHRVEEGAEFSHIYSTSLSPSTHQGLHGLYLVPLRMKLPQLFQKAGFLTFSFSLIGSRDIRLERVVEVLPSTNVGRWNVLDHNKDGLYTVRIGSCFKPLSIECYDIYNNRVPFASVPKLNINLSSNGTILAEAHSKEVDITPDKLTMRIKDIVVESSGLDEIRPNYEATLNISSVDKEYSVSFPCKVIPEIPEKITLHPPELRKQLIPGKTIRNLALEVFDKYGNHAKEDEIISLRVVGFSFQDGSDIVRSAVTDCMKKVDAEGFVDLSNDLKVSKGYGKDVCLSVISKERVIFRKQFVTEVRELRSVTKDFRNCEAGSQLENIVFEITDSQGKIDESIHDEDKHGKPHTLTIKSDSIEIDDTVRYSFRYGCCTIPSIPLPRKEGVFSLSAAHSHYPELKTVIKVHVENARKEKHKSIRNDDGDMVNFIFSNHRRCENDQVLRHSPSFSQETRRALSPRSYKKQVHVGNAREENHRNTRNDEDMRNESRRVFSQRSSKKQGHFENAWKENHRSTRNYEDTRNTIFSNHRSSENDQILRHSPSLRVSQQTHRSLSPRSSKKHVHMENAKEDNHRSTWNDEHTRNVIFSSRKPGENNQILRHSPSLNVSRETHGAFSPRCSNKQVSRETHGTFSPPSSVKRVSSNYSSPAFMTPNMQRTDSQELQNDLLNSGMAVNDHDREFGKLRYRRKQIQQDITDLQASIDRDIDDVSTMSTCDKELVLKQIENKKESAAFVVCKIPFELRPRDILGVVALLGTVRSIELSRMLAIYLGEDQMLAIACRNYTAAYHFEANSLGETIRRGYCVVCLEDIRPRFMEPSSDPQQLLPFEAPTLPNSSVPPGFLGYAVNMIDIDESNIQWRTESGYGLRETLFYRLFGELQVYKDRESMISAQSCIKDGALSLDGGIMGGNGLLSLGYWEPPEILFPVKNGISPQALGALLPLQSLAEKRSELAEINKRIDEEKDALARAKEKLCMTRDKYNSVSQNESQWRPW